MCGGNGLIREQLQGREMPPASRSLEICRRVRTAITRLVALRRIAVRCGYEALLTGLSHHGEAAGPGK